MIVLQGDAVKTKASLRHAVDAAGLSKLFHRVVSKYAKVLQPKLKDVVSGDPLSTTLYEITPKVFEAVICGLFFEPHCSRLLGSRSTGCYTHVLNGGVGGGTPIPPFSSLC